MNRKLFCIMIFMLPSVVLGGHVSTNDHDVLEVMSGYTHKGMFFATGRDLPNPNDCPNHANSKRIIAAIPERSEVDHVLSVALAAKLSKSKVDLNVYDDICFEGWPVLRRIKIK